MKTGKSQSILAISAVAFVAALLIDLYLIFAAPSNIGLIIAVSLIVIVDTYFFVDGILEKVDEIVAVNIDKQNELTKVEKGIYSVAKREEITRNQSMSAMLNAIVDIREQSAKSYVDSAEQDKMLAKLSIKKDMDNANKIINSNERIAVLLAKLATENAKSSDEAIDILNDICNSLEMGSYKEQAVSRVDADAVSVVDNSDNLTDINDLGAVDNLDKDLDTVDNLDIFSNLDMVDNLDATGSLDVADNSDIFNNLDMVDNLDEAGSLDVVDGLHMAAVKNSETVDDMEAADDLAMLDYLGLIDSLGMVDNLDEYEDKLLQNGHANDKMGEYGDNDTEYEADEYEDDDAEYETDEYEDDDTEDETDEYEDDDTEDEADEYEDDDTEDEADEYDDEDEMDEYEDDMVYDNVYEIPEMVNTLDEDMEFTHLKVINS
ncbi:MAG: hypothetical protein NC393_07055 [Clostridium sp.]|nr:hypothetical protein [Clostridium sp.]MCM1171871.1 hypothetical protein [Clostridium sp.]MCM1207838.1 hypothetical protein [Ruminococcus sp.]